MNKKRAFTLIELLVVIAIIAILAAILFPVFAQAKEAAKKTATLTHFKEYGVAMIIYTADNDDKFPKAHSPDTTTGGERWNFYTSVPNGWRQNGVHDVNPRMTEDGMHWGNSTHAYTKNYDIMTMSGIPINTLVSDVENFRPADVGVGFNGILQHWSTTAIARPSRLPLLTASRGKQNIHGFALSSPTLRCNGTGPCTFNPQGNCQSNSTGWNQSALFVMDSAWVYGKGYHFVASDSSAKWRNLDGPDDGTLIRDYNNNPYARYGAGGVPTSYWVCTAGGGVYYACIFRPDQEYNL